jgi:hypothetical protein
MAPPSNAEQERLETLWRTSARAYEEARRREICTEWIQHHERLAGVFHDHAARHERAQERYERLLADMHTTTEGGSW